MSTVTDSSTPTATPIRYLLFDLAGVLLNLDIEADTRALHSVGLPDFEQCQKMPDLMRIVSLYLDGMIEADAFLPMVRPYCSSTATDEQILWSMDAVLGDIPVSRMQMLCRLRSQYKVYLLSNLNRKDWEYTKRLITNAGYSVEQLFDRTFISYQMQLAKPDPRIYQEVIRATGLNPAETLYMDDNSDNIRTGISLGFQCRQIKINHLEESFSENSVQLIIDN